MVIYTVNDMIKELQNLQSNGHGEKDIIVYQYDGGNDVPCYMKPVVNGDRVVMETQYIGGN